MSKHILITGGAGFIGSHLADAMLAFGHRVRALDNLSFQVHGSDRKKPDYLNSEVELIIGDVRDPEVMQRALKGIDIVYHLAAAVGVGQSMYEITNYTSTNNLGTAVLLEALIDRPVERLIVASSMSIYGEGLYRAPNGKLGVGCDAFGGLPFGHASQTQSDHRTLEQLKAGDWEIRNADGEVLLPVPTPETKQPSLASVYALSKYDQERMCLIFGQAYGISTVALRFFNTYGTRQSLCNPYTGVLAIFASRYLNNNPPLIFEDGYQQRDFVSIHDVVQACRLAMEVPQAAGNVFNVASDRHYTVLEAAHLMAQVLGKEHIQPLITGKYRAGDVRHCFADISRASQILGYKPRVTLEEGLVELATWLEGRVAIDRVAEASAELAARGLFQSLSCNP